MKSIPLTNTYGDTIGRIEIEDQPIEEIISNVPRLELGYRVRENEVERFILRIDVGP